MIMRLPTDNKNDKYEEDIFDTKLNTLKIKKCDLYEKYPPIGHGAESHVYKYDNSTALKIFKELQKKLSNKYKKIEALTKFSDESFCFPKGLVTYANNRKMGYFTDLVITKNKLKTFNDLDSLEDNQKLIDYLVKAEDSIKRIHKKGFIIGDIKRDNIMIDINENPKFVDTDNYAFDNFTFDLYPVRRDWFKQVYKKNCSPIDSDKYIYAMMCLQYFSMGTLLHYGSSKYFEVFIKLLNIDSEAKEILNLVFSDAKDKPYITPVLKKINPNEPLLRDNDIQTLNRTF
ncbi:MAG: hypothetical protein PHS54_05525 [Clostridia bacterium]|nr:hypothetical protein [Clostridia bacterium]